LHPNHFGGPPCGQSPRVFLKIPCGKTARRDLCGGTEQSALLPRYHFICVRHRHFAKRRCNDPYHSSVPFWDVLECINANVSILRMYGRGFASKVVVHSGQQSATIHSPLLIRANHLPPVISLSQTAHCTNSQSRLLALKFIRVPFSLRIFQNSFAGLNALDRAMINSVTPRSSCAWLFSILLLRS